MNAVGSGLLNVKGMRKIRVIGMYGPPCRENSNSMVTVLNSLADRRMKHTLVCGDFNIKVNSTDSSNRGDDMLTKYMGLSNMTCEFLHNIDAIGHAFSDHNILIATIGSGMVQSNNELIARRTITCTMLLL